ncbi:MAG: Calx-beta domain-containing protein [Enterobacterales bacterium]|nr:Calx-beta domain-containing protein [Enterobacterales bacterium]
MQNYTSVLVSNEAVKFKRQSTVLKPHQSLESIMGNVIIHSIKQQATLIISLFLLGLSPAAYSALPNAVQAVFVNNGCLNCHSGANPSGGLSLDDAIVAETSLVNIVANCSNNNGLLVDPGSPSTSVLVQKLANANPNCGGVMPPNGNRISAQDLQVISDWIVAIGPAAQFGLFNLNQIAISVQETDPSVTLTVNREFGSQGVVAIDYVVDTLAGDSATSPTDFQAAAGTLNFADGVTSQSITITLVDDTVFEGTETFSVSLSNPQNGAVLGNRSLAKVMIIDNEFSNQPGTFLFSKVNYSVAEDGLTLDVTIVRSFGAAGQVTVDLSTADGTALANSDYTALSTSLVFAEGVKMQTATISIIDDTVEEMDETFTLTMSNPTGGAILGS